MKLGELERLLEASDFPGVEELISGERTHQRLRNDDVAIVRIVVVLQR